MNLFYVARATSADRRSYAATRDKGVVFWLPYTRTDRGVWVSSAPWMPLRTFTTITEAEAFVAGRRRVMLAQFADLLCVVDAHHHGIVADVEVSS